MAKSFVFNALSGQFDIISTVTLAAVGAVPNANGASISADQVLNLQPANGSFPGALTAADWTTFNNKQPAGNYITDLTGDVTATGPGSVAATVANNAVTDAKFRQSAGLSIVGRSANTTGDVADITAASDFQIMRRSGTAIGFGSIDLSQSNAVGASILANANTTATSANTASAIVARDGSGNFSAGTISAALTGTASGNTTISGQTNHGVVIASATNSMTSTAAGSAGEVLTSNGASADPTFQAVPGTFTDSSVWVDTLNANGSTNTAVTRWANVRVNTGTDITFNQSSTNGDDFTINTTGVYSIHFTYSSNNAARDYSITNNSTTNLPGGVNELAGPTTIGASQMSTTSWCGPLTAGDVIRGCNDASAPRTGDGRLKFVITRVH